MVAVLLVLLLVISCELLLAVTSLLRRSSVGNVGGV